MPWYELDPTGVEICGLCGCPVQRTATGTLADGMAAHRRTVHSEHQAEKTAGVR